jgi:hypothetical protein
MRTLAFTLSLQSQISSSNDYLNILCVIVIAPPVNQSVAARWDGIVTG